MDMGGEGLMAKTADTEGSSGLKTPIAEGGENKKAPGISGEAAPEAREDGRPKRTEGSEAIANFIGPVIVLGVVYYFLVWRRLPEDPLIQWGVTGSVVLALILALIFAKARSAPYFNLAQKIVIVLLSSLGAGVAALIFDRQIQVELLKYFAILFFSLLPPWLYLQFICTKGKTIWDEYVLNLFRLCIDDPKYLPKPPEGSIFCDDWCRDRAPTKLTENDVPVSLYQKKYEGLYGPAPSTELSTKRALFSVFRGENLWPVALSTLLISVGWVFSVRPVSLSNHTFPAGVMGAQDLAIPEGPLRFGFLGAYFYVLQMLVRRYFQNDLKTDAYVHAIMRITVVILLVWTLDLVWPDVDEKWLSSAAFVIGVFPDIGWQALLALVKLPIRPLVHSLQQKYPLSDLDGLNTWYEARFMEEGIENMQNLATANLVDVMLNTRIPVDRLVDWVDQALLYMHLREHGDKKTVSDRETLRRFGIRCATDLYDVLGSGEEPPDETRLKGLEYVLNASCDDPSVLLSVKATLKNEPNLFHVQRWKEFATKQLGGKAGGSGRTA